jgi:hypothetical protein
MRYFRKEIPEQAILVFGQPFRFDLLATEDQSLIHELDKCIAKQRGGVIAIEKDEHDSELKKKLTENLLRDNSKPPHQRQELKAHPLPQDRRAVEVVANPGGRRGGMFARPQVGRDGTVLNGRHDASPMPDPIQIPSPTQFITPPVANISGK